MAKLGKRLLENCKEVIANFEDKKFPSLNYSFSQQLKNAQGADDKELESFIKLLMGVFSMYFQFAKGRPFGPMAQWPNGSRTMLPEDLTDE